MQWAETAGKTISAKYLVATLPNCKSHPVAEQAALGSGKLFSSGGENLEAMLYPQKECICYSFVFNSQIAGILILAPIVVQDLHLMSLLPMHHKNTRKCSLGLSSGQFDIERGKYLF